MGLLQLPAHGQVFPERQHEVTSLSRRGTQLARTHVNSYRHVVQIVAVSLGEVVRGAECLLGHPVSPYLASTQKRRQLYSTVHCCFVRVQRTEGPFPSEDVEGDPWYILRDRLLRVKETRADDPKAELVVSFLMGSATLASDTEPHTFELELRVQVRIHPGLMPGSVESLGMRSSKRSVSRVGSCREDR